MHIVLHETENEPKTVFFVPKVFRLNQRIFVS